MACISSRIATVIQVTERAIKGTITDLMSHSQFHCTGRVYLDLHGLIFETSICYWQDQPGSPRVCARAREARPTHPPTDRPPARARLAGGRAAVAVAVAGPARAFAGRAAARSQARAQDRASLRTPPPGGIRKRGGPGSVCRAARSGAARRPRRRRWRFLREERAPRGWESAAWSRA